MHQDLTQELEDKGSFSPRRHAAEFYLPHILVPPEAQSSVGLYLCSASSLETPGLWSRGTWQALPMAVTVALLLLCLCGHPQAAAGKGQEVGDSAAI